MMTASDGGHRQRLTPPVVEHLPLAHCPFVVQRAPRAPRRVWPPRQIPRWQLRDAQSRL